MSERPEIKPLQNTLSEGTELYFLLYKQVHLKDTSCPWCFEKEPRTKSLVPGNNVGNHTMVLYIKTVYQYNTRRAESSPIPLQKTGTCGC